MLLIIFEAAPLTILSPVQLGHRFTPATGAVQSLSYSVSIFDNGICLPNVTPHDCGFNPQSIAVKRDSTIIWTNTGLVIHDVASCSIPNNPYPLGCPVIDDPSLPSFSSGTLIQGASFSFQFTEQGTYYYFSQIHPWMHGVVTVGQPHPVHPVPNEPFTFQNIDTLVHSTSLCCWIAQSLHISNSPFNGYVTVGGNGISIYSTRNNVYPPNIADSGFLTGEAWDGTELLLVGQHYSPQGGVLMFKYNPASGALTDLTSLFPANLGRNATLVAVASNGSAFYILSLVGEEVFPGDAVSVRLYTYTNSTNTVRDITGLLPAKFQTATNNPQEIIWTPRGLFLLLTTSTGTILGRLDRQSFTDLTSLLPQGFHLFSSDGFLTPNRFQYSMLLHGDELFITGQTSRNTIALLRYNIDTSQTTDDSPLFASISGAPLELAYANGQLYIAGFKSTQAPPQPLLVQFNPRTLAVNDLSGIIPTAFGTVGGLATDGETLFLAGGIFLTVQYGIIVPDP
jgi:plastocyanin